MPKRVRPLLAGEWASFARLIPVNAPEGQRIEMRRAFYAGACAMFGMLTSSMDEETTEPTESDMLYVSRLADELQAFAVDLGRGKA